jgi:hypothetical protein
MIDNDPIVLCIIDGDDDRVPILYEVVVGRERAAKRALVIENNAEIGGRHRFVTFYTVNEGST